MAILSQQKQNMTWQGRNTNLVYPYNRKSMNMLKDLLRSIALVTHHRKLPIFICQSVLLHLELSNSSSFDLVPA